MNTPEKSVRPDGGYEWRVNGVLHREAGPARELPDGSQFWFRHGKRHREDGPAAVWADGRWAWFRDGVLHREDGPAEKWPDGSEYWYRDGKDHRLDGPAHKSAVYVDEEEKGEILGYSYSWYVNGNRHRLDGPAVAEVPGDEEWWVHGLALEGRTTPADIRVLEGLCRDGELGLLEQTLLVWHDAAEAGNTVDMSEVVAALRAAAS